MKEFHFNELERQELLRILTNEIGTYEYLQESSRHMKAAPPIKEKVSILRKLLDKVKNVEHENND